MKKIKTVVFLLLISMIFICSCESSANNESTGPDVFIDESAEDYYDYYSYVFATSLYFFETDDGYYYLNSKTGLVYFAEKNTTDFVILCNKPDCDHSDENCNAYAGTYMGYYNGKIYGVRPMLKNGHELIRMNPDGTNHERVSGMPETQNPSGVGGKGTGGFVYFYKGYIINFNNLTIDQTTAYPQAFKVELETGKSTMLFDDELLNCTSLVAYFYPYKNFIWFEVGNSNSRYYYCADLDTCEIIYKIKEEGMSYIGVKEGLLYYYKKNIGFCEYNPETEEEIILKQYDYTMANVVYGEQNIVAKVWKLKDDGKDRDSWMIIMDKSYNIIAQAELPTDNVNNMAFISVTSDYIFLFEGNEAPTGITHYIDLNKIIDGKMTVEKIQ